MFFVRDIFNSSHGLSAWLFPLNLVDLLSRLSAISDSAIARVIFYVLTSSKSQSIRAAGPRAVPGVNPTVGEAHPRPQTGTQAPLPLRWSRETASSEGARDLKEHKGDFIS